MSDISLQIEGEAPTELFPLGLILLILFLASRTAVGAGLAAEIAPADATDCLNCLLRHMGFTLYFGVDCQSASYTRKIPASDMSAGRDSSVDLVAGTGLEPATFGL